MVARIGIAQELAAYFCPGRVRVTGFANAPWSEPFEGTTCHSDWVLCHGDGVILSPQAKNLVGRGRMQRSDEMIHFAQHDTFTLSRY